MMLGLIMMNKSDKETIYVASVQSQGVQSRSGYGITGIKIGMVVWLN
jgi:hypothetical protein